MSTLRLEPVDGRFEQAFRAAPTPQPPLAILLFDRDGLPWMVHPSWGNDPNTPTVLTADCSRSEIIDRAVDLRLNAYWRAEHPVKDPTLRLRTYADWARQQRETLGFALVRSLA